MIAPYEFRQASRRRCLEAADVSRFTEHRNRRQGGLIREQGDRGTSLGSDEWLDNSREIRRQENLPGRCQRGEAGGVPHHGAAKSIAPRARFGGADRYLLGPGGAKGPDYTVKLWQLSEKIVQLFQVVRFD